MPSNVIFKAKMYKIRFPLGEHTALPQTLWLYLNGLLLRGWKGKGKGKEGGRDGREKNGRGEAIAEPLCADFYNDCCYTQYPRNVSCCSRDILA